MNEAIALTISGALLGLTGLSLWLRLRSLTLVDMFLVSIAMFFGAYTIIDVWVVPLEENYDTVSLIYVLFSACAVALAMWGFGRMGPRWLLREVSLSRLTLDWERSSAIALIAALIPALAYAWYTATYFSAYEASTVEQLTALEPELPYWYTSLGMISTSLLWAVAPALWWKGLVSRSVPRLFWWSLTAMSFLLILGQGRRAILMFLVTAGVTTVAKMKRARLAALLGVLMLIPALLVLSNFYQAYRFLAYRGVPVTTVLDGESLVEKALDAEQTVSNLQRREAMWRLNYDLVTTEHGTFQWGRLLLVGIPNYVPAILWPRKEVIQPEDEMLQAFNLPVEDRPNSLLSYTYTDFGHLAIFVTTAIMIFFVWCFAVLLRHLRHPFLRTTLMGLALSYALHMETDYMVGLLVFRDFAVVALLFLTIRTAWRLLTEIVVLGTIPKPT